MNKVSTNHSVIQLFSYSVIRATRKGFTLVELLVVIGIIAVLSSILIATFGGATESARAAVCLMNLRSLANAASAYSMESGPWYYPSGGKYFPLAGSVETKYGTASGGLYGEFVGWISWQSKNVYGTGETDSKKVTSHQSVEKVPYYGTGDNKMDRWALEHGSLWKSVGRTADVYVCPTHAANCKKKNRSRPLFSYVMNAKFGYDVTDGKSDMGLAYEVESSIAQKAGAIARADRLLMFADMDTKAQEENSSSDTKGAMCPPEYDCTLNYKATVNGVSYGNSWKHAAETLGFIHKGQKNRMYAHVVFADGHTEKIVAPGGKIGTAGSGLDKYQLTAALCEGLDVSCQGNLYRVIDSGKIY